MKTRRKKNTRKQSQKDTWGSAPDVLVVTADYQQIVGIPVQCAFSSSWPEQSLECDWEQPWHFHIQAVQSEQAKTTVRPAAECLLNGMGRLGRGHAEHPRLRLVELAQASWELWATKLVPGERSGHVWTASVTGLVLAAGNAWCLRHSPKSTAGGEQTRPTSQVKWEQVPLTTVQFLSNRKKRTSVNEAELRRGLKHGVEGWCWWENQWDQRKSWQ